MNVLNGEIVYSLKEAQIVIENWHVEYNTKRPHSALGHRPPAPTLARSPWGVKSNFTAHGLCDIKNPLTSFWINKSGRSKPITKFDISIAGDPLAMLKRPSNPSPNVALLPHYSCGRSFSGEQLSDTHSSLMDSPQTCPSFS